MESERVTMLASIGLAATTTSPALLHAIRGRLHDVTMLTALLQAQPSVEQANDASKTAQRLRSIGVQIDLLDRNLALLAAMIARPSGDASSVCTTASALPDVVRLLADEAARQRLRFEHDLDSLPPHIQTSERALQQALLACGAWTAQHAGERATMRLSGREDGGDAIFEFDSTPESAPRPGNTLPREDLELLAMLANAAGGRLVSTPKLRLVFAGASGRTVVAA
jgi:hypothetical protein